jgi:hypothetical protein
MQNQNKNITFEGYLTQVAKTVHGKSGETMMGYRNIEDLKIGLVGIEEFLNNNPPSTDAKFGNATEAIYKFHNLKYAAKLIKEDLRDILLRIHNLTPLIKQYESTDQ